jgi:hypothetical protein
MDIPQMIYEYGKQRWNDIDRGKPKKSEKNVSNATLSTPNPTWIDLGANLDLHSERLVTNRLSYGMANQRYNLTSKQNFF